MDEETIKIINEIIDSSFTHLKSAKFCFIFDTKKRRSGGRYIVGKLAKANDVIKHISADNIDPEGVDYIFFLDKQVFDILDDADRTRIIRHTLQYADVDYDGKNPYKLRQAEVQTFYEEMEYNKEDPEWMIRLNDIADAIYSADEE